MHRRHLHPDGDAPRVHAGSRVQRPSSYQRYGHCYGRVYLYGRLRCRDRYFCGSVRDTLRREDHPGQHCFLHHARHGRPVPGALLWGLSATPVALRGDPGPQHGALHCDRGRRNVQQRSVRGFVRGHYWRDSFHLHGPDVLEWRCQDTSAPHGQHARLRDYERTYSDLPRDHAGPADAGPPDRRLQPLLGQPRPERVDQVRLRVRRPYDLRHLRQDNGGGLAQPGLLHAHPVLQGHDGIEPHECSVQHGVQRAQPAVNSLLLARH